MCFYLIRVEIEEFSIHFACLLWRNFGMLPNQSGRVDREYDQSKLQKLEKKTLSYSIIRAQVLSVRLKEIKCMRLNVMP